MVGKQVASGGLAGFGAAKLQDVAACGLLAEVVIEGDNAMDFSARNVERFGDDRLDGSIDIPESVLQGMKDR